jgi:hypothetical protein
MEQVQTIVCPNCGAVTASNQNCEYCGSMLTKVATALCKEGDDVKASLKDLGFGKSAYVSNKLLEVVERTIKGGEKYNTIATSYSKIGTCAINIWISYGPEHPLNLSFIYDMTDSTANRYYSYLEDEKKDYKIGKLFHKKQNGNKMFCIIELDKDVNTSVQFIQYLLKELFSKSDAETEFKTLVEIDNNTHIIIPSGAMKAIEDERNRYLDIKYEDYIKALSYKVADKQLEREINLAAKFGFAYAPRDTYMYLRDVLKRNYVYVGDKEITLEQIDSKLYDILARRMVVKFELLIEESKFISFARKRLRSEFASLQEQFNQRYNEISTKEYFRNHSIVWQEYKKTIESEAIKYEGKVYLLGLDWLSE